jgi:hypothetical protein
MSRKEIHVKKSTSNEKVAGNRRNSKKSPGPGNTTSTRFNATKHGLLAVGITELDDPIQYRNTLSRLQKAYFAESEAFLLKHIALTMIRLQRNARLEAECITEILNPPIYSEIQDVSGMLSFEHSRLDRGLPARVSSEKFEPIVRTFQRYETALENKLFRAMHEVERLRSLSKGEKLPAPVAVDLALHSDNSGLNSFAESADTEAIEGFLSEQRDEREDPSPGVNSPEVEAATSLELDAGGLVSFVEPPKAVFLEGSGVEPPDEEQQTIVAPQEGEAAETPTGHDE